MTRAFTRIVVLIGASILPRGDAAAQQLQILNGQVTSAPAGTPFSPGFRKLVSSQAGTGWIGYTVPIVERQRLMCCDGWEPWYGDQSVSVNGVRMSESPAGYRCRLEPRQDRDGTATSSEPLNTNAAPRGAVQLEGSERVAVLYRVIAGRVDRIRLVPADCVVDAGGRQVQWVEGVRAGDSIDVLESFAAGQDNSGRVTDGAIMAIALHGDPGADASLERLSKSDHPEAVRKKVLFWLGSARGRNGFDRLRQVLRTDPSIEVRKSAVFGLSRTEERETVDTLASIARTDSESRLRSEALFWLAQKAGRQAASTITASIDEDPDTEVKKKAVFALSQLPKEEGVPLLISVARTNTNPAVRKQAMFWLGQSKDPRAIDFFTQILK
ncbi:MAG: HEAT repeat domain-containing protein [Acidobacteriota bacterium]|nr:HEAT repeat domain-containing protein [Acidobacteriota bacterium]